MVQNHISREGRGEKRDSWLKCLKAWVIDTDPVKL